MDAHDNVFFPHTSYMYNYVSNVNKTKNVSRYMWQCLYVKVHTNPFIGKSIMNIQK